MHLLPLVTHGNACPHCRGHTYRVRMPILFRMVRHISPAVQRRACINPACAWQGFAHPMARRADAARRVDRIEKMTSIQG